MLREMNKDQAYFIALLAQVARIQRDKLLGNVAENDLGGAKSSRGEHNPTALLGFEPLPAEPTLQNIRNIVGIVTYGRPWYMAKWMGDPPRKIVTRYLRWFTARQASVKYLALYHLNVASETQRNAFVARVEKALRRL